MSRGYSLRSSFTTKTSVIVYSTFYSTPTCVSQGKLTFVLVTRAGNSFAREPAGLSSRSSVLMIAAVFFTLMVFAQLRRNAMSTSGCSAVAESGRLWLLLWLLADWLRLLVLSPLRGPLEDCFWRCWLCPAVVVGSPSTAVSSSEKAVTFLFDLLDVDRARAFDAVVCLPVVLSVFVWGKASEALAACLRRGYDLDC